jgi:acyl transferase domain-containing protein
MGLQRSHYKEQPTTPTSLEDLELPIIELQRVLESVQDALHNQMWSTTKDTVAGADLEEAVAHAAASAETLEKSRVLYAASLVCHRLSL